MSAMTPLVAPAFAGMAIGGLGPVIALLLAGRRWSFWQHFAIVSLGGPLLACLGGWIISGLLTDGLIALISAMAGCGIQALISLMLFLFGRGRPDA